MKMRNHIDRNTVVYVDGGEVCGEFITPAISLNAEHKLSDKQQMINHANICGFLDLKSTLVV